MSEFFDKATIGGIDIPCTDANAQGRLTTLEGRFDSNGKVKSENLPDFLTGVNGVSPAITTVASVPVDKSLCIVTIADGQTAQSFSLASAPSAGRTIHVMVDNSGNTSDLTITVPHGTTNGIDYVNTNDLASGSMEVAAGMVGEINIVYASSKAWVRYIGA
jgi:hypothetical protein